MGSGIADRLVFETPIAVLDFETTGLNPGSDRVVEVSVVRMEPGGAPELALDTLVNPRRPVAATEIHGITDEDVVDAPEFGEIAEDVVNAVSGCVLAAYNVYFDMRFLDYEFNRAGVVASPPHICLMYLRPMLGLGGRCSLGDACSAHGIDYAATHVAADDVQAAARLMDVYFEVMKTRGIRTFRELAQLRSYKFVNSFSRDPLEPPCSAGQRPCARLRSRVCGVRRPEPAGAGAKSAMSANRALGLYWDALRAVLADLKITDEEIGYLKRQQEELGLKEEQIRVLHARAFTSAVEQFIGDQWLDDQERATLKRLHACLHQLGWAPGE